MKKIYKLALASLIGGSLNAQTTFWTTTSYKGAFPVTDNTTASDWTSGWSNFDPENAAYGAPTTTVNADITANTTWTTGTIVLLENKIYVKNNAVLTIQPGVVIRGDKATQGTLLISKGAKIIAQGTSSNPIVFTSSEAVGSRAEGDWGGVVILGSATHNQPGGVANIEGIVVSTNSEYGGSNDQDSSGVFSYVRIEFPGIAFQPNKEINGLTFGSVGSKTKVDHIQISFSGDDSFEWFGGTVDAKYLIAFRGTDDDFDTDFGYRGRVQFGLIVRDPDLSDAAGDSNGFESDNDATGTANLPRTQAVFSNITNVGPLRNGTITLPAGEKFERAFYIRRNSSISIFNSVAASWQKGVYLKDAGTVDNFTMNDSAVFANNLIASDIDQAIILDANITLAVYNTIFSADVNDSTKTTAEIAWVNGFPSSLSSTPDYRLQSTSLAASGASFSHPKLGGSVTSGINEKGNDNATIGLYPNPVTNDATMNVSLKTAEKVMIIIYDITGKALVNVFAGEMNTGMNSVKVNTSALTSGIYFTTISSDNFSKTVKFVVAK
ncbi:MAG: T9SS type A sorting domain-containing protein [Bacteroidota bacterium]